MSSTPGHSEADANSLYSYDEELSELLDRQSLTEGTEAQLNCAFKALSYSPAASHELDNDHDYDASTEADSIRTMSTADDTASYQDRDSRSAASISDGLRHISSPSCRPAHREYLSPLRAKRLDGLRASLSPGTTSPRLSYLQPHSRSSSMASMYQLAESSGDDTGARPEDIIKWTKLRKITDQLYTEAGRRAFGTPTCFVISGVLAIGTSKGLVLVYDYQQTCKHIIGTGTAAVTAGSVSALALSADHTFAASGHENGSIFSWDLKAPATPAKHIEPILLSESSAKSGHIRDTKITHLSFVRARHSCFVSADVRGMVFYHSFNRRRIISILESTRILGRYPNASGVETMKSSTTFDLSTLPLGNVPHFTDDLALLAILTPYRLVIVSTSPVLRTHFKFSRPSGLIAECTEISGCAAWYPSMLILTDLERVSSPTKPALAFVWSKMLHVLEVEPGEVDNEAGGLAAVRTSINIVKQYPCSESVVSLQWFSNEIICLLTGSHQLLLLDIVGMTLIGNCDLIGKQVLHHDLYTSQLQSYFEQREAEYVNQTFADSYCHSLQTYKGRTFLLGVHGLSMGTLVTWADKVIALISSGHQIQAIRLLLDYYKGSVEIRGLNLPSSENERRLKLRPKIYETVLASVKYSFASEDLYTRSDAYHASLLDVIFESCLLLADLDFLFNELFEIYEEEGRTEPFLKLLSTYILNDDVVVVPPSVIQQVVLYFVNKNMHTRLEDIICHLDARALDVHQITQLCKLHDLYNSLTYVMTEALLDYVAPMVEFIGLMKSVMQATHTAFSNHGNQATSKDTHFLGKNTVNAVKVYPYLSMTLTGKVFPIARSRPDLEEVERGKSILYDFLFSGGNVPWPPGSGTWVTTGIEDHEPTFPYLRLLLMFDCPTFLACLEDAFEDSFLNETVSPVTVTQPRRSPGSVITRQFVVNILLDVMSTGFSDEDLLYLYMFIARNVPKYSQFILLSGSLLQKIIVALCHYVDPELADDCELSVEYLLSVYKPAHTSAMLSHYREAGFQRVLKNVFRADGQWTELLLAHLEDESNAHEIFDYVDETLGFSSTLTAAEKEDISKSILGHVLAIVSQDPARAAVTLAQCLPEEQGEIFDALADRDEVLYVWLRQILHQGHVPQQWITLGVREKYIELLCLYDPDQVNEYIKTLDIHEIHVARVIDNLETYELSIEHGFIDSIVYLMSLQGQRFQASQKVTKTMERLGHKLNDSSSSDARALHIIEQCIALGAGLCRAETQEYITRSGGRNTIGHVTSTLSLERMWVELLTIVTKLLATASREEGESSTKEWQSGRRRLLRRTREALQVVFRDLLDFTADSRSMLLTPVLRSLWNNLSGQSTDIFIMRELLREAFASHQYYAQLLSLADKIFASDLFARLEVKTDAMQTGWEVKSLFCAVCQAPLYDSRLSSVPFRKHQEQLQKHRIERHALRIACVEKLHGLPLRDSTGKKRDKPYGESFAEEDGIDQFDSAIKSSSIVSHACGHLTHETCLQATRAYDADRPVQCSLCV